MKEITKVIQSSGKRKRSIARASLRAGGGIIRINKQLLGSYSPALAQARIMEPLTLAGDIAKKVNINIDVKGGGWHSQAEAVRLAISRGLVEFDKKLKKTFLDYDRHLLIADVRRKEQRKPNKSKARKMRAKSYR